MFRLSATVKCYRGRGQETANLNKYYGRCLRVHLSTLSACRIFEASQVEKYEGTLRNNEIGAVGLQGPVGQECHSFVHSPLLPAQLLSSTRMSFNSKLMAIKYVGGLDSKMAQGGPWKQGKK